MKVWTKWPAFCRRKCIFLNEDVWTANMVSLNHVPKDGILNTLALVQVNGLTPIRRRAITWINGDDLASV